MKALSILALLVIASPAFAQAPAANQDAQAQDSKGDQKPFVYDSAIGRNDFSQPNPVIIGSSPAQNVAPVRPLTPKNPAYQPDAKPAPKPAPSNA